MATDLDAKWTHQVERMLSEINADKSILPKNKETIEKFMDFLKANGAKPATLWRHIYCYGKILRCFDKKTVIINANKEEITKAVSKIRDLKKLSDRENPKFKSMSHANKVKRDKEDAPREALGEGQIAKVLITLKFIFKHFKGDDLQYPREVAWIKYNGALKSTVDAEELITLKEFEALHKAAKTLRSHAILEVLRLPIRPHEIQLLRRKHLVLEGKQPSIKIPDNTKTHERTIPIFETAWLASYVNNYSDDLKPEDPLFAYQEWSNKEVNLKKAPMTYDSLRTLLKKLCIRAGIRSLNLYQFRHTAITWYLGGMGNPNPPMTTSQLSEMAGSSAATLEKVYKHLVPSDVWNGAARANGIEIDTASKAKSIIKRCPRCEAICPTVGANWCPRCGMALSMVAALNETEIRTDYVKSQTDPELKAMINKAVAEALEKAKKKK